MQNGEVSMKNARWIVIGTENAPNQKLLKYATVLEKEHSITTYIILRYTIILASLRLSYLICCTIMFLYYCFKI